MPVVTLDKGDLYERLGRQYSKDEFDQLCFEFGIELEEDSDDDPPILVDGVPERPTLKIDIPANRYDLLCLEGIALALNIFLERAKTPNYRIVDPPSGEQHVLTIHPDTEQIRPYAAAAVLRGVKLDKRRYESFIALQDKLHANLCRARSLVAIGTHDMSTIKGPFTYEAPKPEDIDFIPLNQTVKMNGHDLMKFYSEHRVLNKFLPLIRDSPVYPVIYDANHTVCSLPPIINSDHSKITLDTRDIFIECTATDQTKLEIVLNIMVSMFSQYAAEPFTVESVEIRSEHNGCSRTTPSIAARKHEAEISYINSCTGLEQSADTIVKQLSRMSMDAKYLGQDLIEVSVPCTRADILHQCDIMEDVAIAYGYNNLAKTFPDKSATVGQPFPINKLSDIVRREAAMAGFTECMPLILCSREENFAWLRKTDDSMAVTLANPKTIEYQIARTSLLPGCLKTIRENRKHALPIKVFEVSDVVFKNMSLERRANNQRNFCAIIASTSSNFEVIHGLLDRIMKMLSVKLVKKNSEDAGYWIEEGDDATFFPGRNATVQLRVAGQGAEQIGTFGVLHPEVLQKYELPLSASALELNVEKML